jgi:hypothetical protein
VARYPPTQGCQQVVYSYPPGRCVICQSDFLKGAVEAARGEDRADLTEPPPPRYAEFRWLADSRACGCVRAPILGSGSTRRRPPGARKLTPRRWRLRASARN